MASYRRKPLASFEFGTRVYAPSVLDRARRSLARATVQNVGSAMRSLVTFAFKNRWLPREADPMWMVRYSASAEVQGQAVGVHRPVIASHRRGVPELVQGAG